VHAKSAAALQCHYNWLRKEGRPNNIFAQRLAELMRPKNALPGRERLPLFRSTCFSLGLYQRACPRPSADVNVWVYPPSQFGSGFKQLSAVCHADKRWLQPILKIENDLLVCKRYIFCSRFPSLAGLSATAGSRDSVWATPQLISLEWVIASIVNPGSDCHRFIVALRGEGFGGTNLAQIIEEIEPIKHQSTSFFRVQHPR
jgi:hypothetical protein